MLEKTPSTSSSSSLQFSSPLAHTKFVLQQVLLTIIQPDNVVSAIHSFVKDRKEARLLDQVKGIRDMIAINGQLINPERSILDKHGG